MTLLHQGNHGIFRPAVFENGNSGLRSESRFVAVAEAVDNSDKNTPWAVQHEVAVARLRFPRESGRGDSIFDDRGDA